VVLPGGTVAQQLARDHPNRVDRLALVCTYPYNLLSRRERVEGRLSSWLLATVGPAPMAGLVARGVGGPALSGHFLAWTHTAQLVEIVEDWLSGPPDRNHESA
jgi:pimeloyl-ACP methyl ester carboxylesterase